MVRHLIIMSVPFVFVCGCGGGDEGTDDATPSADSVSADGSATDGAPADGSSSDGSTTDGTAEIVQPTVDDSAERAKVRDMDVAKLVETLSDPVLSNAAVDELVTRGTDVVKPLTAALESNDTTVQQRAIFALGQLGEDASDALPKLKQLAAESNSEVVQDSAKFAIDAIEGN